MKFKRKLNIQHFYTCTTPTVSQEKEKETPSGTPTGVLTNSGDPLQPLQEENFKRAVITTEGPTQTRQGQEY